MDEIFWFEEKIVFCSQDFRVFHEFTNLKFYDVIIDITAY